MEPNRKIEWVLRIAVAGEFFGHGIFAVQQKAAWLGWLTKFGFSAETAPTVLTFVGVLDILLALLVLVRPVRLALLWMTFWGFWTALVRPLVGEPFWDFVERWANWGAPLALLLLRGRPRSGRELIR